MCIALKYQLKMYKTEVQSTKHIGIHYICSTQICINY